MPSRVGLFACFDLPVYLALFAGSSGRPIFAHAVLTCVHLRHTGVALDLDTESYDRVLIVTSARPHLRINRDVLRSVLI